MSGHIEVQRIAKVAMDATRAALRPGQNLAEVRGHCETKLCELATPSMTFEELSRLMNEHIVDLGYENLDFLGNLGHSIATQSSDRVYIEPGNQARLDSVDFFTFEPHIRRPDGAFGYKHEDIYHFTDGRLKVI